MQQDGTVVAIRRVVVPGRSLDNVVLNGIAASTGLTDTTPPTLTVYVARGPSSPLPTDCPLCKCLVPRRGIIGSKMHLRSCVHDRIGGSHDGQLPPCHNRLCSATAIPLALSTGTLA